MMILGAVSMLTIIQVFPARAQKGKPSILGPVRASGGAAAPGAKAAPSFRAAPHRLPESSVARWLAAADTPLNLVETPDGFLVSTNSGYGRHYLQAIDKQRREVTDLVELPSLWYGLAYWPAQRSIVASTGAQGVLVIPLIAGKFRKGREITLKGCELTAGLALQGSTAMVACNQNHQVIRFNLLTGEELGRARVGEFPYAVKELPGRRVAVSNWGGASISILEWRRLKLMGTVHVGSHPSDMLVFPGGHRLAVACSDSDLISVIDLDALRETRRINIRIPGSKLGGAQPDALAFDPRGGKMFVALAAVNALAAVSVHEDLEEPKFEGLIPVGAYPTALLYSPGRHTLYIADGRNPVSGPSAPRAEDAGEGGPPEDLTRPRRRAPVHETDSGTRNHYVGDLLGGRLETIADGEFPALAARMRSLAQQVYGEASEELPADSRELIRYFSAKSNPQAPVRHVIYVIKENRTYDQVLGDLKEGNGARDLVLFGEPVTPNHHAIARQFVLFDNFYVDGDVSADGHLWSTAALSTDYVNKLWPSYYAQRLHYDFAGPDYDGDDRHDHPIAIPASGFIWEAASRAGVTYRDYGEWCTDDKHRTDITHCYVRGLKDHYDPHYVDTIGTVTDQERLQSWEHEFRNFEKNGDLPQLTIMHLPNDHTVGTQPGRPTPRAMVGDNDAALGHLVDVVSHSRFWPETAIFVLEDDAQDGPDHVDAHRSPLLVISPYVRRGTVEHEHFSTASVLKTIEQILGLPSLTYFDDRAPSLLVEFQKRPALEAYNGLLPQVALDEKNRADAPGAEESARWDFSRPDRAPDQQLNRVIWKSVKGRNAEPPATITGLRWPD